MQLFVLQPGGKARQRRVGTRETLIHNTHLLQSTGPSPLQPYPQPHSYTVSFRTPQHREMKWKSQMQPVLEHPKGLRQMIQRTICVQESFLLSLHLPFQLYLLGY